MTFRTRQPSITTTVSKIVGGSEDRTGVKIKNTSATTLWIVKGKDQVKTQGYPIEQHGEIVISPGSGDDPTCEYWGISDSGTITIYVMESFNPEED